MANDQLAGYAALFNSETVIAGLFRERIAPGAFRDSLQRKDDVRALFNHDPNYVLGRTKSGTLTLREDNYGLHYTVQINPNDPAALSVVARAERRDVSGSSFAFAIDDPNDEEWQLDDRKKLPLRILRRLRLVDVSPVVFPAYEATSVAARMYDAAAVAHTIRLRIAIEKARTWQTTASWRG